VGKEIAYFARDCADFVPHQARQYVFQKRQVEVCFLDFELGVAGVQGERGGVCFTSFDGASEEVEGEEFHCGVRGVFVVYAICRVVGARGVGDVGIFFRDAREISWVAEMVG
jgi:hypothetical protein